MSLNIRPTTLALGLVIATARLLADPLGVRRLTANPELAPEDLPGLDWSTETA